MIEINKDTGLIKGISFRASSHCDERPHMSSIDLIVIHGISLPPGKFGGDFIDQFFLGTLNPEDHPYFKTISHLHVSSHLLIRRDGTLIQYVPFSKRAWHAGKSEFRGRKNCNDFSIGIELEGLDDIPYEESQYHQLAKVICALRKTYSIPLGHLAGHDMISPGRKTDPGPAFSWTILEDELR